MNPIKAAISSMVPDGRIKDAARFAMHKYGHDGYFSKVNGHYELRFRGETLKDHVIMFPRERFAPIAPCCYELPCYFERDMIREGSTVIDAGAFPGDFTVVASRKVGPKGRVVALEPNPENRDYLERVLSANGVGNVTVIPYALSDVNREVYLTNEGASSRIDSGFMKPKNGFNVMAITLENLLREQCKSESNIVLKMDIEGEEVKVISPESELWKRVDSFAIACYHYVNGIMTRDILKNRMGKNGYGVEFSSDAHLTLFAGKIND